MRDWYAFRRPKRWRPLPAFLLWLPLVAGCTGGDADRAARTYTVRGEIVTLPASDDGEIRLAHEAIDDFVSAGGERVGMDAMTMSFPLATGVSSAGLAVGDVVEFDLEVDWDSRALATVTRLEPLPTGTKLTYRAAEPGRG